MKPMFILALALALVVAYVQGDENENFNVESFIDKGFDFSTNIYIFNSIVLVLLKTIK